MDAGEVQVRRAVVTGAAGQDGSYLCELLLEKGYRVIGVVRAGSRDTRENLKRIKYHPEFRMWESDLLDPYLAIDLACVDADEFYHLGALTHVGDSFHNPTLWMETNVVATSQLLWYLKRESPQTKFYFAASSEMFPHARRPKIRQDELSPLGAHSPYAVSKVAGHLLTKVYREAHGMFAVSGIAYNHESPRRGHQFVTQKIVKGVRDYLVTGRPVVLGNMDACRDWHHARDTVKGMWLALQYDRPQDYVFASGESRSVKEFAEAVCEYYGVKLDEAVTTSPSEMRPLDVPFLLGDPSKAESELGWKREYDFKGLVEDMCCGE